MCQVTRRRAADRVGDRALATIHQLPFSPPGVTRKREVTRLPAAEGPVLAFVLDHGHREVLGSRAYALGLQTGEVAVERLLGIGCPTPQRV